MSDLWDYSVYEKGVISVFKKGVFVGAIESTSASHEVLTRLIDDLQQSQDLLKKAIEVISNVNKHEKFLFDTKHTQGFLSVSGQITEKFLEENKEQLEDLNER